MALRCRIVGLHFTVLSDAAGASPFTEGAPAASHRVSYYGAIYACIHDCTYRFVISRVIGGSVSSSVKLCWTSSLPASVSRAV